MNTATRTLRLVAVASVAVLAACANPVAPADTVSVPANVIITPVHRG
ncbi:MAG TPA: hypothetical protein VF000_11300 [Agromyces sp.]|jgi:hypothetical protein